MQKNKLIAGLLLGFIAISASIYFVRHKKGGKTQGSEPNVEEILAERAKQSSRQLETPLGKAVETRNWAEVEKLYHADTQYLTLGEIIRALYIENKMKNFGPDDHEKLMALVVSTFDQLPEKNLHLTGILISQFDRLPTPKTESANYKTLKKWALSAKESPLKRKLGITKLVIQNASPDPEISRVFQKTLSDGDTFGQTRTEWIQRIDEIRNQPEQTACVEILAKNFKKIPAVSQPAALFVLSHHLNVTAEQTKNLTLQFLQTEDPGKFETALRALPPLLNGNYLKEAEKALVVKKLTNLPTPVRTPFVEMKSSEILKLLGHI